MAVTNTMGKVKNGIGLQRSKQISRSGSFNHSTAEFPGMVRYSEDSLNA